MSIVTREVGADFWVIGALPLGVGLDLILGDPRGWPHPVRAIGRLIDGVERALRMVLARLGGGPTVEVIAGATLAMVVVGVSAAFVWLITDLADQIGGPASLLVRTLLIYWGLAIRSLGDEALRASEATD